MALPYAQRLVERRRAGEQPWLVIVQMGEGGDSGLKAALLRQRGCRRVRVPDRLHLSEFVTAWAPGLDVLVVPFCDTDRLTQYLGYLWRAKPSTLWQLDAGNTATRLYPFRRYREGRDLQPWHPARVPLDSRFRDAVQASRELALLAGDEPLFDQPEFAHVRDSVAA